MNQQVESFLFVLSCRICIGHVAMTISVVFIPCQPASGLLSFIIGFFIFYFDIRQPNKPTT